ncbi:laccase 1 [Mycena olivaceomarginata]|nr:laccase 1 [Mycena olivaceomarginata]
MCVWTWLSHCSRGALCFFFLSIALAVAKLASAATVGPVGDIVVANASVTLDGTTRPAVLFWRPGDRFQLNVVNNQFDSRMLQSTSIHGSPSASSPAFITQCPIAHGNSFLYDFTVNQAGTFWYHSHLSTQYCDGLRGPMVVYDPQDPYLGRYDVDDETTVLTLADWCSPPRWVSSPYSTALRYRIRLVNIACSPNYVFQIDGHTNLTHYTVDQITIFAGQRYSFILNADQAVGNYLMVTLIGIRANPSAGTKGFAGGINSAILRYVGATDADPTSTQDVSTNAFVEANMRTGGKFAMNGVSFVPPTTPVLLQILSGAEDAQSLLPTGSVFPLPKNSLIQVSIPGGGQHPFHLHGHAFDVVRSAGSSVYNYANPVSRNAGDNVTIRFVTDNDGPWFLHCHIDWHLEAGLAIVFAEDVAGLEHHHCSFAYVGAAWNDLCPAYDALGASDL